MTNKEAIEQLKHMKVFIGYDAESPMVKEMQSALDLAIKALEQQLNRCDSCVHSEEQDGSNCYECVKGMTDNFESQPCEDCVSRESVYELLAKEDWADTVIGIKELPSVTPQPKVGKWIAQDIHNCHTDFKCSECGYIHSFTHLYGEPTADYTYCPRCGAKMEVEE